METGHRATEEEHGDGLGHALHVMRTKGGHLHAHMFALAAALEDLPEAGPEPSEAGGGRARKVSVSMPEDLSAAVRLRVGRGEFSRYVTEAVACRLKADLLTELMALLDDEHGEVSEGLVKKAESVWPDAE